VRGFDGAHVDQDQRSRRNPIAPVSLGAVKRAVCDRQQRGSSQGARSGHPKWLGSFKIRRAAGHADILQAPVAETHQLVARTRAVLPLDKALFHFAPAQPATGVNGYAIQGYRAHGSLHEKSN